MKQTDVKNYKPKLKSYVVRDDLMRSLMLRVYPSGKKSWLLDYKRPDGRRNTIKLGDAERILSPVQARDLAREKLIEVTKGFDPKDPARHLTLKVFVDKFYLNYIQSKHRDWQYTLSILNKDFEWLMDREMESIPSIEIQQWIANEKSKNKAATVNRKLTVIKSAFSWAKRHKLIINNELSSLESLTEDDSKVSVRYLSSDERERLIVALKGNTKGMYTIVMLAMHTGLRRNAIFSLKWEDVNLEERNIRLLAISAKSRKISYIPINDTALRVLSEWKELSPKSDFVFPSPVTGEKLNNVKKSWATILKEANIENFRFHDLRHDFASRLVMRGVDLNTVRELMTHSDIRMTLKYAHLAPEKTVSAVKLLD